MITSKTVANSPETPTKTLTLRKLMFRNRTQSFPNVRDHNVEICNEDCLDEDDEEKVEENM